MKCFPQPASVCRNGKGHGAVYHSRSLPYQKKNMFDESTRKNSTHACLGLQVITCEDPKKIISLGLRVNG